MKEDQTTFNFILCSFLISFYAHLKRRKEEECGGVAVYPYAK